MNNAGRKHSVFSRYSINKAIPEGYNSGCSRQKLLDSWNVPLTSWTKGWATQKLQGV